jgi:hypothetical protein
VGAHTPQLKVPAPSPEVEENELAAVVHRLVSEVQEVQQALTDSISREDVLRQEVESVRNVLTDLEGVVMRELLADRLEPELGKVTSNKTRSKKSKQKNSYHTTKGEPITVTRLRSYQTEILTKKEDTRRIVMLTRGPLVGIHTPIRRRQGPFRSSCVAFLALPPLRRDDRSSGRS